MNLQTTSTIAKVIEFGSVVPSFPFCFQCLSDSNQKPTNWHGNKNEAHSSSSITTNEW